MTSQVSTERDGFGCAIGWPRVGADADTSEAAGSSAEVDVAAVMLGQMLRERSVWPVLQPVVELQTGAPAGYEAFARGPVDHPLHRPADLLETARSCGRLGELDTLCRERALESADEAGLGAPAALFVNVEPESLPPAGSIRTMSPDRSSAFARLRERGVQVVVELTERRLLDDPARLLAFAERARASGCGIALDDVGADPAALALIPMLQPDVVKLDLGLIHGSPDAAVAQAMVAVSAYAEANGAAVVAEGVETEEQEAVARSLGATHGQGWRFGRPVAPGQAVLPRSALWRPIVPRPSRTRSSRESVFALAAHGRTPLEGTKALLIQITLLIERQAADMGGAALVLAAFQDSYHFGDAARERFAELVDRLAFVGGLGAGFSGDPLPGMRGSALAPGDPVRLEWSLVVVGPHFSVALAARDRGETGPELSRRFDYVLTHDRSRVLECAYALLMRLETSPEGRAGVREAGR